MRLELEHLWGPVLLVADPTDKARVEATNNTDGEHAFYHAIQQWLVLLSFRHYRSTTELLS